MERTYGFTKKSSAFSNDKKGGNDFVIFLKHNREIGFKTEFFFLATNDGRTDW